MLELNEIIQRSVVHNKKDNIEGVYFLIKNDIVVYVGSSSNCMLRIDSHKRRGKIRFNNWFIEKASKDKDSLEAEYIRQLKPKYNIVGNPDYMNNRSSLWFNFLIYFESYEQVARQINMSSSLVTRIIKSNNPEKIRGYDTVRAFFDAIIDQKQPSGAAYVESINRPNYKGGQILPITQKTLSHVISYYQGIVKDIENELSDLDKKYQSFQKETKRTISNLSSKFKKENIDHIVKQTSKH